MFCLLSLFEVVISKAIELMSCKMLCHTAMHRKGTQKKQLPKLVFPDGVFWDKKICNYRTKKRNAMFELLDRISGIYGDKKEPPLREAVPLCGDVNLYRTFLNDLEAVYLFGLQIANI